MNTQNNEKKKISWFKTIRPIALVLVLVMLLTYATYSWMKRDWTPDVHEENIKIVAGSSLVFLFNGNPQEENVSIDDLVPDLENFVFKSVSNCSGDSDDFIALKYDPRGEYFDKFKHISMDDERDDLILGEGYSSESRMDYTMLGKKYGYIELTFQVKAPVGDSKHVMLDPSSIIKASSGADNVTGQRAVNAMRVSITVPDTSSGAKAGDTKTIIYVPYANGSTHTHVGVTNNLSMLSSGNNSYRYIQAGESNYDAENPTLRKDVVSDLVVSGNDNIRTLWGPEEKTAYNQNIVQDDYYLFTLDNTGTPQQIIVRIWLEGEDSHCTDKESATTILGGELDILVKFDAEEVA